MFLVFAWPSHWRPFFEPLHLVVVRHILLLPVGVVKPISFLRLRAFFLRHASDLENFSDA